MKDSTVNYNYRTNDFSPPDNLLMKCLKCGEDSNGFLYHCRDCNDILCQSCVNAHLLVIMTKDHVFRRIDNPNSSISSSMSSLLSFNSTDALDETGIASNQSHISSQTADTIRQPNKENRQNTFSELTRAFLYGADSENLFPPHELDFTGEIMDSIYNKFKTAEVDIRALMQKYRLRVDEREKELLNELTASITVKKASLKREMKTYKAIQSSYERSMHILDGVLQSGKPFDILRAKEICDLEIQNARDLHECALFPEEKVVFIPPDQEVLNGIQQMGKITVRESKTSSKCLQENAAAPSLRAQSKHPTTAKEGSATVQKQIPKTVNAWARPIKFTDEEPKPIRAIIPSLISNHIKVSRQNTSSRKFTSSGKFKSSGKFDYKAAGQPKMIIGKEGSNEGELSRPWGVCCTNEGNIIVADRSNHRIQIFGPDCKFKRAFGKHGKEGQGCFDRPAGVAVDPRGRIFITDKDNHRIQVFTQDGEFVFMFGKEGKQCGQFHYPWDIAVNSVGHVVVTDTRNQRIQMFSNNGMFLRKFGIENVFYQSSNLDSPRGICFNTEGNLVITDFNNHRLLVIDSDFKKAKFLGGPGYGQKQFMRPQGVAVDNKGKIAIADSKNNRIQIINEDGTYVWQFGCGGSDPGQLDRPCGVCFTPDGKIVVVDFGNNRVQIF